MITLLDSSSTSRLVGCSTFEGEEEEEEEEETLFVNGMVTVGAV